MSKLQWNFNQNMKFFIHENTSEYIVCEMAAILSRGEMSKRRTTKKIPSHYWLSVQRSLIFSDPMDSPQRCQWYFIIPSCKYSALLKSYGIFLQRTQSSPCCLFGVHNLSEISSFVLPGYIRPRYIKSLKYRHNPHKFYISEIFSNPWPTYQHCGILPY